MGFFSKIGRKLKKFGKRVIKVATPFAGTLLGVPGLDGFGGGGGRASAQRSTTGTLENIGTIFANVLLARDQAKAARARAREADARAAVDAQAGQLRARSSGVFSALSPTLVIVAGGAILLILILRRR